MQLCVASVLRCGKLDVMPRQARIDAPGGIHHLICRGIERSKIFVDDSDRDRFVFRLSRLLQQTATHCYAWVLMPNHFHLLLQTGSSLVSTIMRRLLTGYAVYFNRRHDRVGHLFQNRYKSILCQKDSYLLELVRYIHLNPVRAHLVSDMKALAAFPYSGHRQLLKRTSCPWQDTTEVLRYFSETPKAAREKYVAFVADGIAQGKRADLIGGGLIRSSGGWQEVKWAQKAGVFLKSDERILGDSNFVEEVLESDREDPALSPPYLYDLHDVTARVAELLGVEESEICRKGKHPATVKARSLFCYWATRRLGMTTVALAKILEMSQPAVSRAAERGEALAKANDWNLADEGNT